MADKEVYYPCALFNSSYYESVVVDIRVSLSVFSFIGSLFVIILIWLFKKHRFFTQRLILYLCISSLISSIAYLLGRVDYSNQSKRTFCVFTGCLLLYSDWSVLLSTIGVTLNLLLKVVYQRIAFKYEIVYVLLSFGAPMLFVWIPFTADAYGPSGAWCWIRNKLDDNCSLDFRTGKILQFAIWYVPLYLLIAVLFLIYLYIIIAVKLKARQWQGMFNPHVQRQRILMKEEIKPLLWYPIIYLCVQFFPFLNRIVTSSTDMAYFPLYVLHVATSPLTGVLIAFAYALDKETLRRLNWRSIKANLMYRSTDQMVKPYDLIQAEEEEVEQSLAHLSRRSSDTDTEDDEKKHIITTPLDSKFT